MKTLLLIGGTGFFGKSFLDAYKRGLLDKWGINRIFILSRNSEKIKTNAPELLSENIELLSGDICAVNSLPNADYVIHAAASTDSQLYLQQPSAERRNIEIATYHYARLAKYIHINSKILYVSSGAVYGAQPSHVDFLYENHDKFSLENFGEDKREYAFAKRSAEKTIQELGRQGIRVAIARCFAFVGPWLARDQHFAIGNFIEDGLNSRTINVKANFPIYRSYMHADDLAIWLMTICEAANYSSPIYNVGSNEAVEIRDLAKMVAQHLNVNITTRTINTDKYDRYVPSIDKAKDELGLKLTIDLDESIYKTIEAIQIKKLHA